MVMGPAEPETKNDCAGEGQQQFTRDIDQLTAGRVWLGARSGAVGILNREMLTNGGPPSIRRFVGPKSNIHENLLARPHVHPEDGGSLYLRNVNNTAHIHTMQRHKSWININNNFVLCSVRLWNIWRT
jgi:hypothetical protein